MFDHNKSVARRCIDEFWNRGDFTAAKELVTDDIQFRSSQIPPFRGVKQLEETVAGIRAAFPDGRFTIDETVAEGDTVVQRWTFRGTHRGEFFGAPGTGKQVAVTGTDTSHFTNGKIAEHMTDWDALLMLQQIGVVKS